MSDKINPTAKCEMTSPARPGQISLRGLDSFTREVGRKELGSLPTLSPLPPPGNVLLSYRETLNWIAFTQGVETDLVDPDRLSSDAAHLLAMLEAIATGQPPEEEDTDMPVYLDPLPLDPDLPPPPDLPLDTWGRRTSETNMIESRALRLISQTGRSAEDLAAQVRIRVIERIERLLRFESAIAKLTEAIVDRKVTTTTAPDTGPYKGRTSPGHQLGVQLRGLPPGWFFRRDVLALWPVAPADNPRDSKKPTSAAARRVWKEYVAGHLEADTMPTFQDGLASLRASFPGQKITIAVYKDLRASDITPPEWREAGRRR